MSKRTRYFMMGSIATLVFGLSVGLVAYYNGGLPQLGSAGGPVQLRYVPSDAVVVAYADVHKIMNSEFRLRLKGLEAGKGEQGQQEFRDETGIDLEKDVESVVAFMTPGQGDNKGGGAVIVTGRFDPTRIENLVKSKGGEAGDYRGKKLMTFVSQKDPDHGGALVFLAGNVVAVGSLPTVRKVVDLGESAAAGIKSNDKMDKMIAEVGSRGDAWVVGRFDALTNHASLPEEVTSRIPPISWFYASGRIDNAVDASLTVETRDTAAAQNLMMVIQGLKGLAGLQAGSGPNSAQMQQALQSFGVTQDGEKLTVAFRLPSELLLGLASQAKKHAEPK